MTLLSGAMAAQLSQAVYNLRMNENLVASIAGNSANSSILDAFDIDQSATRLTGRSGAFVRPETGFGMLLKKRGTQGEYALVCRGTHFSSGADWASNFNIALDRGPGGYPVHAGFHRVYKSMALQVREALRGKNLTTLHVCGHSLGGAIATMFAAEYGFAERADVKLYTFGAPRAGTAFFTRPLTRKLGTHNVRRVYALADPVPMIPVFPFCHPEDCDYSVDGGQGTISVDAHSMKQTYIPGMPASGWPVRVNVPNFHDVNYWLNKAEGRNMFSSAAFWALGKALKGIIALAEVVLGSVLTAAMTILDQLAAMLVHAARLSAKIGSYLLRFVKAVMKFVGRSTTTALNSSADVTSAFLRYALELMMRGVGAAASRAVNLLT
ncbi:hypothetical protein RM543_00300 [Roseicyclus sp. F158]|uniref:Fungal lipase-type domain-containing protein n=1 Tax=Tropicimonas omnivorans TaxID=3075590 RepID=A0ABU3DBM8_9RHOB|nr:hypothetical protein [Roseicyclus sp. F158]MDT0681108.1 hypothetical protein [Roseicyclus sp. F158]